MPGSTMPIRPLVSTATAIAAQASHIQRRACACRGSRMLGDQHRRRARTASAAETPMSSELKWLARFQVGAARRISAGPAATRGPNQRPAATTVMPQTERAAQRDPEPRLPFADAERLEGKRRHPHLERRLLEVLEAVVADRDPVAAGQHLARDLGVAAFVAQAADDASSSVRNQASATIRTTAIVVRVSLTCRITGNPTAMSPGRQGMLIDGHGPGRAGRASLQDRFTGLAQD